MQIRYKASGEAKHVQNDIGHALIAAGLAVEIPPAVPKPIPNLKWNAREGKYLGIDFQYPPYIFFTCSTCGVNGCVENVSDAFVVRHCGITEKVPSHVREDYDRLMKDYRARSRNRKPEPVSSAVTDTRILNHFGIKSSATLRAELAAQIAASKK